MRKIVFIGAAVSILAVGMYLGFKAEKAKPGGTYQTDQAYDQADNEKRNAEFLAAQRAMEMQQQKIPEPPPAEGQVPPAAAQVPPAAQNELPPPPPVAVQPPPPLMKKAPPPPVQAKAQVPKQTAANRKPAKVQVPKFKPGMKAANKKCEMKTQAKKTAKVVGTIPKGKKIWVSDHDANWATVNLKSGAAYVLKSCF